MGLHAKRVPVERMEGPPVQSAKSRALRKGTPRKSKRRRIRTGERDVLLELPQRRGLEPMLTSIALWKEISRQKLMLDVLEEFARKTYPGVPPEFRVNRNGKE